MRVAWQNQNLRRMGKYEQPPLNNHLKLKIKASFCLDFVSLHRQAKEQSSCANSRSSMMITNVQETAFWGIVIQGTFKHRQSVTN